MCRAVQSSATRHPVTPCPWLPADGNSTAPQPLRCVLTRCRVPLRLLANSEGCRSFWWQPGSSSTDAAETFKTKEPSRREYAGNRNGDIVSLLMKAPRLPCFWNWIYSRLSLCQNYLPSQQSPPLRHRFFFLTRLIGGIFTLSGN